MSEGGCGKISGSLTATVLLGGNLGLWTLPCSDVTGRIDYTVVSLEKVYRGCSQYEA